MSKKCVIVANPRYLLLILQKSTILVVTAATDISTSACTPDAEECFETSRCVMFEFLSSRSDVRLVKLGQGNFNGPATGLEIFLKEDSE